MATKCTLITSRKESTTAMTVPSVGTLPSLTNLLLIVVCWAFREMADYLPSKLTHGGKKLILWSTKRECTPSPFQCILAKIAPKSRGCTRAAADGCHERWGRAHRELQFCLQCHLKVFLSSFSYVKYPEEGMVFANQDTEDLVGPELDMGAKREEASPIAMKKMISYVVGVANMSHFIRVHQSTNELAKASWLKWG